MDLELLEINNKWIRIDVIDDYYIKSDLRAGRLTSAKEAGYLQDIWLNTDKVKFFTDILLLNCYFLNKLDN